MATSPPLPPSPSLDDLCARPITPITVECDVNSLDIFPPIDLPAQLPYVPPPIEILFPDTPDKCYNRGRSRSRSPASRLGGRSTTPDHQSPIRICGTGSVYLPPSLYYTTPSSASRSSSPDSLLGPRPRRRPRCKRYTYRSRTPSPMRPYTYPSPQVIYPPPPPIMPLSSISPPPPVPSIWPSSVPMPEPIPVDILTFHYNGNMSYAPAPKTFDEAIDNVLELWPDLRDVDRDRIHLYVGGADQIVRVPKMAWQLVMCDLPRYEIMHIQVDQLPPPPQYQSDGKGNWASGDEKKENKKQARSGGFFSSIKRVFWR